MCVLEQPDDDVALVADELPLGLAGLVEGQDSRLALNAGGNAVGVLGNGRGEIYTWENEVLFAKKIILKKQDLFFNKKHNFTTKERKIPLLYV